MRSLSRAATAITIAGFAAAFTVLPASAANESPDAPNFHTHERFCTNPSYWYPGYVLTGGSNDGRLGSWRINNVTNEPGRARFDTTFYTQQTVSFVSWHCAR
ncbi:hypothetical protein [Kribbella sp. NPDC023855]|uniref:hypothetical protein n=1 Tax=Kribbella sp. NPDC023855 TaxID=3154698 RepID=UPI003405D407